MFKQYFLAVTAIFFTNALYAETEQNGNSNISVAETAGFMSGAILGGLAGGPPGVILGIGFGAVLGDKWASDKEALKVMQVSLQQANLELASTKNQLTSLNQRYNSVNSEVFRRNISYRENSGENGNLISGSNCCEARISIHFKTGNSEIEEHYKDELKMMVSQANKLENSRIEIFGYADRKGNPQKNLELSKQRSNSVKKFLTQNGIDQTSVTTVAYGDTKPLQSDSSYESDFFDRRVTVHIRADGNFVTKQLVKDSE